MNLEEGRQPLPHGRQVGDIAGIDLFEDGEEPALFVMIVYDQMGDIQGASSRDYLSNASRPIARRR